MIDGSRQTGRTTRMLAAAIDAHSNGATVIIIGATRHEVNGIASKFWDMGGCNCSSCRERAIFKAGYDFDKILQGYPEDAVVFIDHHAVETAAKWLPGWLNKELKTQVQELEMDVAVLESKMEQIRYIIES